MSLWIPPYFEKFLSINLLGPQDMFLSFAQKFPKYFVDRFYFLLDFFNVR